MEGEQQSSNPDKVAPREVIPVCGWCDMKIGADKLPYGEKIILPKVIPEGEKAKYSHGICLTCSHEYFPEDEKKESEKK
ncbi:MAG: hypothetical protein Q7S16_00430 [bacterium]|nr:hypothetical protein [bacterium]